MSFAFTQKQLIHFSKTTGWLTRSWEKWEHSFLLVETLYSIRDTFVRRRKNQRRCLAFRNNLSMFNVFWSTHNVPWAHVDLCTKVRRRSQRHLYRLSVDFHFVHSSDGDHDYLHVMGMNARIELSGDGRSCDVVPVFGVHFLHGLNIRMTVGFLIPSRRFQALPASIVAHFFAV